MAEKFHFFWGNTPLSNWHPSPFKLDGVQYNCTEQHMMAEKAIMFKDQKRYDMIMATSDPSDQKRYGRQVAGFDKDTWSKKAREIVYQGCLAKFSQNPDLKKYLLATGTDTLVEASPSDTVWGIGLSKDDPRALVRSQWRGTNWLGEVLMRVRNTLTARV